MTSFTGDFDGDTKPDIAVYNSFSNNLSVLMGDGNGNLGAPINTALEVGYYPSFLGADFSGDQKTDLALVGYMNAISTRGVLLLVSQGNGMFNSPISNIPCTNNGGCNCPSGIGGNFGGIGDFTGDGRTDVVVSGNVCTTSGGGAGVVVVLKDLANGTFQAQMTAPGSNTTPSNMNTVVGGDFDGDGKLDAVALETSGQTSLIIGNGDGSFGALSAINGSSGQGGTNSLAVADVDADGNTDLILGSKAVAVLRGKGNGTFHTAQVSAAGGAVLSIASGDFNGDGKLDLVTANSDGASVTVLIGRGDGTFLSVAMLCPGSPSSVVVADFNKDGKPDIAVAETTAVEVYLNTTP